MKKIFKTLFLAVISLLTFTGCQTYFGYNTQSKVTTQTDFHKEYFDSKRTWEKYTACYSKPIPKEDHDKFLKEAEERAEKGYGRYRDYETEKRYQSWKNELFENSSHRYRIRRGVKEGVFPVEFLRIYSTPQSFQKAQEDQKYRRQEYIAASSELKKTNIPEAIQISSTAQSYFYKNGSLYGNYIVKMQEPKLAIEIRSHLYSKNAEWVPPFVFLRYPFDFIACFCGDWELAEHKPDIFTLISYCPPFSWFFTRTPPYFTGPSAQRTKYQVIISPQDTVVVDRKKIQKVSEAENPQAVKWLKNKAEAGDAVAQFDLAMIYDEGKYIGKNTNKALELFSAAVKSGNASVEERIISLLSVDKIEAIANKINDSPMKMRILKVAADKGSVTAQYSYAVLCERNNDKKQALKYYEMAANKRNIDAAIAICQSTTDYYSYSIKEYNAVVKNALQNAAKTDDIVLAEKIIKRRNGHDFDSSTAFHIALKHDSVKVAELLSFTSYVGDSALATAAALKDSKCLPVILTRKKFSLEALTYALGEAIKCNSTKNVRLILKYMDPLLKPKMSIGMNCAVPISKNNQEILAELKKRKIKIDVLSLEDLIKLNSSKVIEHIKVVLDDNKKHDSMVFYQNIRQTKNKIKEFFGTSFNLASPAMDRAMFASAETGNIEVLKLLIANGGEINCANDKDETPLIVARNKGHMEYVKYIASKGGTDSFLEIRKAKEQIKVKRENYKVQKIKNEIMLQRLNRDAEIRELRQKFYDRKPDIASTEAMRLLADKKNKILWLNSENNYVLQMAAVNLRLSSTPQKGQYYGTVDTILATEDLYPTPQTLYKWFEMGYAKNELKKWEFSSKEKKLILVDAICSLWAKACELKKIHDNLRQLGVDVPNDGYYTYRRDILVKDIVKSIKSIHSTKKTFRIMVKIEKGADGLEYITVESLDPYVSITDSNLF